MNVTTDWARAGRVTSTLRRNGRQPHDSALLPCRLGPDEPHPHRATGLAASPVHQDEVTHAFADVIGPGVDRPCCSGCTAMPA